MKWSTRLRNKVRPAGVLGSEIIFPYSISMGQHASHPVYPITVTGVAGQNPLTQWTLRGDTNNFYFDTLPSGTNPPPLPAPYSGMTAQYQPSGLMTLSVYVTGQTNPAVSQLANCVFHASGNSTTITCPINQGSPSGLIGGNQSSGGTPGQSTSLPIAAWVLIILAGLLILFAISQS